jgi:hypothetical protein
MSTVQATRVKEMCEFIEEDEGFPCFVMLWCRSSTGFTAKLFPKRAGDEDDGPTRLFARRHVLDLEEDLRIMCTPKITVEAIEDGICIFATGQLRGARVDVCDGNILSRPEVTLPLEDLGDCIKGERIGVNNEGIQIVRFVRDPDEDIWILKRILVSIVEAMMDETPVSSPVYCWPGIGLTM